MPPKDQDHPFDAIDEASLRRRESAKWRFYEPDVLPAWVAEMDYPIAEPIAAALKRAVDASDAGYAIAGSMAEDFAVWAKATWGWSVDPGGVLLAPDVVTAIAEVIRVSTDPGDGVVIEPPVYPPFAGTVRSLGRRVVAAPLARGIGEGAGASATGRWEPDLDAIARAYASGARLHLLCSPQNPTGIVLPRETLASIAELADKHGVLVVSDEIHAPLTLPGASHTPLPMVSDTARARAIVLTSASKAWNIAGLKAAFVVATQGEPRRVLSRLTASLPFHAGHFGVLATRAAFREGAPWLAQVVAILDRNRRLLGDLLAAELPSVRYVPPRASYLAWIDCASLGLGDDPAREFLLRGRVATSSGPTFGAEGAGFVRLNIATSRGLLEEAVRRMKRALGQD
jgi:cystathionine beta-lyase